jgi:LacI family transcriptional regulator
LKHVSIRDVATGAGVSFQTVSKVLNGKGSVSPETRSRILQCADDLGYSPNYVARSLVTNRAFTIGVLASDLSDYVLAQIVVGAEREARRHGHGTIISTVDKDGSDGERNLHELIKRRVDGILLAAPQMEENQRTAEILRGKLAAVSIHHVPGGGISRVGSDHSQTGFLATRHLIGLGHRHIATITTPKKRRVTESRLDGYRLALAKSGIPYDPDLVEEGGLEADDGYEAAFRLLRRRPDLTAIFVHTDMMAVGVLSALHDLRRRVPEDCAVVGCDDVPFAARTVPPLTTVRVPFYETGETAARLLLDSIGSVPAEPQRILLPVALIVRSSCGAVPSLAPGVQTTRGQNLHRY